MNERLKRIREYQKKGSARREDRVFVAEGIRMAMEMPADRLRYLVVSRSFMTGHPEESRILFGRAKEYGAETFLVSDDDYAKITDTKTPQGVMGVLRAFDYTEEEILSCPDGLYMLLENLQDPGNLGTILRAGEAAGVDGVILSAGCADICNPKVIRSTMGSFFRMKFAVSGDLTATVRRIQERGGRVYAAQLSESVPYDAPDYRGMTAFLIGNEARGLSGEITLAADSRIRIPMEGRVESLNAAMAATILMFEAKRQRK